MPTSPLKLSHPKKFETRSLPVKDINDTDQKAAHKIDNKILQSQAELAKKVQADEVTLSQFCDTVADLEKLSRATANFRADGFSKEERQILNQGFKKVGTSVPRKIDPQLKALYQQVQGGFLKADELTEELNWKTQQTYGAVVADRPGPVFEEERYKFRASLYIPRQEKDPKADEYFHHPELPDLVNKAIDLFPLLDQDQNGILDRREARALISDYVQLGLTPAEATTLYSRQKELAAVIEPKTSGENLKMEDLELLLPENFPKEPSEELKKTVTHISTRLRHQLKIETPEPAPFILGDTFQPSNVKQGREGSCWFLCNLPSLSAAELAATIKPEGDGYRATLADGRTSFVAPLNEAERRTYSTGDGAWSGLLEKGVSQILNESRQDINGGFARVGREMLSGSESEQHIFYKQGSDPNAPDLRNREVLFEVMEDALDRGSAILAAALTSDFEEDISEISAASHAYTVLDVDRETDTVIVRNPWGRSEQADLDGVNNGVFELSQDQFFANFSYIYMDELEGESVA
jgi:Calpain family cysteine protease